MGFVIHLGKENFKFSCTHFTIFGPKTGERLHGHNYQVRCSIEVQQIDSKLGMAFDFNVVKPVIKSICDRLDERILIPAESPYLQLSELPSRQLKVVFAVKEYVFPNDDVMKLPLVNITSEELARYFCKELKKEISGKLPVGTVADTVEETLGQSVTYTE
jgi:6-pyruvoyltetrahydropterin/6-carboxytetrahydropterin synthase